jgi:beta-galactosidase
MHDALLLPNAEPNEAYHVCKQIWGELRSNGAAAAPALSDVVLVLAAVVAKLL